MSQAPTTPHGWGRAAGLRMCTGPPPTLRWAAGPWARRQPQLALLSTHLCDFASPEVGKALQGEREDVGGSVDGEAFAGWHFLLAPAQEEPGLFQLFQALP